MGNLKSVTNAINYLGYNVFVSNKASEIGKANALVLPGWFILPSYRKFKKIRTRHYH